MTGGLKPTDHTVPLYWLSGALRPRKRGREASSQQVGLGSPWVVLSQNNYLYATGPNVHVIKILSEVNDRTSQLVVFFIGGITQGFKVTHL